MKKTIIGGIILLAGLACASPSEDDDGMGRPAQNNGGQGAGATAVETAASSPQSDGSVGEGTYEVGQTIQPGKWSTKAPADSYGCYWQRSKDASGSFDSIIANGNIPKGGPGIVQIAVSDKFVTFSGDCRWTKSA